jgi:hypothetical protein
MIGDREFDAKGLFMLIVAKHRNGELGEIPLQFIGDLAKITNLDDGFSNKSNTFVQQNPDSSAIADFSRNMNSQNDSKNDMDFDSGKVKDTPF